MDVRIVQLEGLDAVLRHRDELDALAESAGSYFHTAEWLSAWARIARPSRLTVHLARDDSGTTLGYVGTATLRRRLHRRVPLPLPYLGLAGSGYGAADHLGPVGSAESHQPLVEAALATAGRRAVMWESVDPQHSPLLGRQGLRTVSRKSCPRIDLRDVGEERDLWPKKLLKELRRRERRMTEEGIRGRWIDDPGEVLATLPSLRSVHLERWRSQQGAGLFDEDRMQLLQLLCTTEGARFTPVMYVLETPSATVASLLLFRCGSTMASYKSGWSPELQQLAPGVAMHAAAIRRSLAEGRATYDFLRGTSGHKYTLRGVDRYDETMIGGRGPGRSLLELRETDRTTAGGS